MTEEKELTTEEKLEGWVQLYELDSENWDAEIFLDELERLYRIRETINRLILTFKDRIKEALK